MTRATITRRAAIGTLGAAGLGFALFGPRSERSKHPGRIVIDYWEKWTRHEGEAMQKVVDAFNESQSRIYVRQIVTSSIGQKAMIAIAGGNPPDVVGLYAFNIPPYAESNAILPMDELGPAAGISLDHYAPGVRQVMQHQGRWWGAVNTAGSIALYYNRAIFREAELDPNQPPRTIAELDEVHRRLTRVNSSGDPDRAGFLHFEPGWWSWLWPYHFESAIYDAGSARSMLADPRTIDSYRWMQSYSKNMGVERALKFQQSFGNYFTPENPFLTGKLAMIVQGPWVANLVNAFRPDLDYGVAPFPTVSGVDRANPVGLIDTDILVIPRGVKHPEASMEFIAFTQRPDMTELLANAHCKPSPLLAVSDRFVADHPNRGIAVHYDILRSSKAFIAPPTRVWQQFKDEVDSATQRLWRHEAQAEELLPVLDRRVQSFIDRAAEQRRLRSGTA